MRILTGFLLLAGVLAASPEVVSQANSLYQRTEYESSLRVLAQDPAPEPAGYLLTGKNYFMLGDYNKAVDFFERAVAGMPASSEAQLWLGRAWGRRAEGGAALLAVVYATRARDCFEKAVALSPHNNEAKNDLFDFYLNAPGILGGGIDKAEAEARSIASERPAEYEFEEAELAEKRHDDKAAEAHLRRAAEFAPNEPGRIVDLARFVAKRGRVEESDRLFEQARRLAPNKPGTALAEARTDIETHRNLEQARKLLQSYLRASLTPDDPPRREAEKLLKSLGPDKS